MIRILLVATLLVSGLALVPSGTAHAQGVPAAVLASDPPVADADARVLAKQAGITRAALNEHTRQMEVAEAGATHTLQSRTRRGQTLMIVGGAAFLAGLIIGDDAGTAIAIGGAAVGLYGLYLWAQ
jgi:hypothetical protein